MSHCLYTCEGSGHKPVFFIWGRGGGEKGKRISSVCLTLFVCALHDIIVFGLCFMHPYDDSKITIAPLLSSFRTMMLQQLLQMEAKLL